jgi:hypothetical protein
MKQFLSVNNVVLAVKFAPVFKDVLVVKTILWYFSKENVLQIVPKDTLNKQDKLFVNYVTLDVKNVKGLPNTVPLVNQVYF